MKANCSAYVEFLQRQTVPVDWAAGRSAQAFCIMCNRPAVGNGGLDYEEEAMSIQRKLCSLHLLDAFECLRRGVPPETYFAFSLGLRAKREEQGKKEQTKRANELIARSRAPELNEKPPNEIPRGREPRRYVHDVERILFLKERKRVDPLGFKRYVTEELAPAYNRGEIDVQAYMMQREPDKYPAAVETEV